MNFRNINIFKVTFIFLMPFYGISQAPIELHLFGGLSIYRGDLQEKIFTPTGAGQSLAVNLKAGLTDHIFIRGGLGFSKISADDKNNPSDLRRRNLSFHSNIEDVHLAVEYRLFSPDKSSITPYAFAGVGAFRFNPYAFYGDKNEKIYLQPLGTEGQGMPEYPDRKVYKLTQVYLPFGGGLLWHATEKLMLGVELKLNPTFTDYLDDVSSTTVNPDALLAFRGPQAVAMAWRRVEFDGTPYPAIPRIRGNPDNNDWFYQVGITVGYLISAGNNNKTGYRNKGKNMGCPKW